MSPLKSKQFFHILHPSILFNFLPFFFCPSNFIDLSPKGSQKPRCFLVGDILLWVSHKKYSPRWEFALEWTAPQHQHYLSLWQSGTPGPGIFPMSWTSGPHTSLLHLPFLARLQENSKIWLLPQEKQGQGSGWDQTNGQCHWELTEWFMWQSEGVFDS